MKKIESDPIFSAGTATSHGILADYGIGGPLAESRPALTCYGFLGAFWAGS